MGALPSVLGSSTTYELQDMRLRLSPGIFCLCLAYLCLTGWALADGGATTVTRQDEAYRFAPFADGRHDGRHDGSFAEWWYFNLVEPEACAALPLVYERTADITGTLWEKTPHGEWRLLTCFAGTGFKEYTNLTTVDPQ
jgi:hypothetical protein